eukprot:CAMPEP_0202105014 /NCGR_PEP_ID=MMETSP0965-20130614/5787_1 /ASSEMBLY_ACC=CAM_ASM_000507 /TAXON_ID=4773 /ORGANISM="Schizochytrium aggregatum, Strain ATCC28209" /LENGTH=727 /DNA_ID=CAMNT_0048673891 /DNA_START=23 /DNA_END=2201 /DNA_ORIENTATION=-
MWGFGRGRGKRGDELAAPARDHSLGEELIDASDVSSDEEGDAALLGGRTDAAPGQGSRARGGSSGRRTRGGSSRAGSAPADPDSSNRDLEVGTSSRPPRNRSAGGGADDGESDDEDLLGRPGARSGKHKRSSNSGSRKKRSAKAGKAGAAPMSPKEERQSEFRRREEQDEHAREQASRQILTAKDLDIKVDRADLESASTWLPADEVVNYVSVPLLVKDALPIVGNASQLSTPDDAVFERVGEMDDGRGRVLVSRPGAPRFGLSRGNRWKEEVYVENVTSGRFNRVLYELDEQGRRLVYKRFRRGEESLSEFSPARLRSMMANVEYVLEGIFMVGQGLLAGGSLFQLIVALQIQDPAVLLSIYGPIAGEVRRMFFFLTVFSFVGVCDKITAERAQKKNWADRGAKERAELLSFGVLMFVCFVFTLLSWPVVSRISDAFEYSRPIDSEFVATLTRWRLYVGLRFVFSAFAWLLICKDANRDLLRGRQRFSQVERCQANLEASSMQLERLGGKGLDGVSENELRALNKTLATGLEEVQLQLQIRDSEPLRVHLPLEVELRLIRECSPQAAIASRARKPTAMWPAPAAPVLSSPAAATAPDLTTIHTIILSFLSLPKSTYRTYTYTYTYMYAYVRTYVRTHACVDTTTSLPPLLINPEPKPAILVRPFASGAARPRRAAGGPAPAHAHTPALRVCVYVPTYARACAARAGARPARAGWRRAEQAGAEAWR